MFHTAKIGSNMANGIVTRNALKCCDGCHIVFHIVNAGKQNSSGVQNRRFVTENHIFFQIYTLFQAFPSGKVSRFAHAIKGICNRIITIENQNIPRLLIPVEVLLCPNILLHILMYIQMVGR